MLDWLFEGVDRDKDELEYFSTLISVALHCGSFKCTCTLNSAEYIMDLK